MPLPELCSICYKNLCFFLSCVHFVILNINIHNIATLIISLECQVLYSIPLVLSGMTIQCNSPCHVKT